MKTAIITQARMTSTRLPGKVLKTILDKPLLEYHVERLQRSKLADDVIVATTLNSADDLIVKWCEDNRVHYFRGSENDVLSRYYYAAKHYDVDVVARVTSDCPLIDPAVIDKVIFYFLSAVDKYHCVSNTIRRTYPRGMDVSVFSFDVLKEINLKATSQLNREHVTSFIYENPQTYLFGNVEWGRDASEHRWTVDTIEDFSLVRIIIEELYPNKTNFSLLDCLNFIEKNPELKKINSHIEQK